MHVTFIRQLYDFPVLYKRIIKNQCLQRMIWSLLLIIQLLLFPLYISWFLWSTADVCILDSDDRYTLFSFNKLIKLNSVFSDWKISITQTNFVELRFIWLVKSLLKILILLHISYKFCTWKPEPFGEPKF